MILTSTIQSLARKYQTTELNIRREYVQHLFLSYFYQQPSSRSIYFKGGTAIRLVFGSPRFSEDLDFSTSSLKKNYVEDAIIESIDAIKKEGVEVQILVAKETSGGYLAHLQFELHHQRITLELNVSQRKEVIHGEVVTIASDLVLPYTVVVLSEEELVQEKLDALVVRQKPRDFFDLYFILRKNIKFKNEAKVLGNIFKILVKTTLNFEQELKYFLPKSHWPIMRDFKGVLEREIKRIVS